ncbi:MAG: DCC1-like thiol-disulfide oxidoreductase family protein [Pseudomonadota bacterium]
MKSLPKPPHSYRADPAVPEFPDTGVVLFVDGTCALCSVWARFVSRYDRHERFRLAAVQSPLGRAMLGHYGLDPDDPDSWLCVHDGHAYEGFDAIAKALSQMSGWPRFFAPLFTLGPRGLRRWVYARIARNRYSVLGRTDMCALPDARLRARLIG